MIYNKCTDVNESTFEDIREFYEITDKQTIYDLLGDCILLDRYADHFDALYDRVVDVASLCWSNKDENGAPLQNTMIKFKRTLDDEKTYELPLYRFMCSLAFIRPFIDDIADMEIDCMLVDDTMTDKKRQSMQQGIAKLLEGKGYPKMMIHKIMAKHSYDLKHLLLNFAHADMQIFTAGNLFLDHYMESEIIREINNTNYPPTAQPSEINEENRKRYEILKEEMIKRNNPFFIDDQYTKLLKPKQMEELYINFSQVPDGKDLIPVVMNGNGFRAGYENMEIMYAGSVASRVPDIMNKDHMGEVGYFARNVRMLTYGTISKTVYDCGSKHTIKLTIKDKDTLRMLHGRNYYADEAHERLRTLHEDDYDLIGKTLDFRSPCTCNLNEDVCHVCYGSAALNVGELPGGFIYTSDLLTSRVQQNVLSAKHLLRAESENIDFNENFGKYFDMENSEIYMKNDEDDNPLEFIIYIPENYEDDIMEELVFYVLEKKKLVPVRIANYANISIDKSVLNIAKKITHTDDNTYLVVKTKDMIKNDIAVFAYITPINILMTKQYLDIKRLFEFGMPKFDKIDDAVEKLMELTMGVIPILSVHNEIILAKLVRKSDNKMIRPNYLEDILAYQLVTVKTALENAESVASALAFEKVEHHLNDRIFDKRRSVHRVGVKSFIDYLFGYETL